MIDPGDAIDDVELTTASGTTTLRAEVDRYLVIQVLRYYG
jgi:hypothetical protein